MSARSSLGRLFSVIWSGVDGLRKVLHLLVLLFIFAIFVGAMSLSTPNVPGSAALVIQPVGRLVEQLAGDPFERALAELTNDSEPQTLVQDVIDGLAYAKEDERISSIVLDLSGMPGGGLSKLKRIGDAIDNFRTSGKPVIATADYFGQAAYYLAARADDIYMHPEGSVFVYGFGAYQNYYKDAIDKLKIDWNVFRVGTYKSAVEPFLRNDMSEADRLALTSVLDQLWAQYKNDVQVARDLEPGSIDGLLDNLIENAESTGGDLAALALQAGLIDELLTRNEITERVVAVAGSKDDSDEYPATTLDEYLQEKRLLTGQSTADNNVALVVAAGEILNGNQSPGVIGGDSTAKLLRQARDDDSVKAVVFRVDSPGGSSFASEVILNEIVALKAAGKPVVVSMGSVAASGGYWVSMAADKIFASDYTITGSIGIFGMFPTFQRSFAEIGISTDGFGTTPWAGQLRVDREMSEEAKALFQLSINRGYHKFISSVAENRSIDEVRVDEIAQGRIWSGKDALEIGLIDEIGDLDHAVAAAAELAGLNPDSYGEKRIEQELGARERILLDLMSGARSLGLDVGSLVRSPSSVERVASMLEETLSPLTRFNDPRGIYAHCFCLFE